MFTFITPLIVNDGPSVIALTVTCAPIPHMCVTSAVYLHVRDLGHLHSFVYVGGTGVLLFIFIIFYLHLLKLIFLHF